MMQGTHDEVLQALLARSGVRGTGSGFSSVFGLINALRCFDDVLLVKCISGMRHRLGHSD